VRVWLAFVAALAVAPVAAWLVRVGLSVVTMPLGRSATVVGSKAALRLLRIVVGGCCGAAALESARWLAGLLGAVPGLALSAAVLAMTALFHLRAVWPMRGTPQLVEDLFWLVGETAGIVAVAAAAI
jgi:hypothetical protein